MKTYLFLFSFLPLDVISSFKQTIPIFVLATTITLLIFLIWLIRINRRVKSQLIPELFRNYVAKKINESLLNRNSGGNEGRGFNNEVRDLQRQLQDANDAISKMQKELADIQGKFDISPDINLAKSKLSNDDAPQRQLLDTDIFYLSTPNSDGSFDKKDAKMGYVEGASIYRFMKTLSNRAQFSIENNDDAIRRALLSPDKRIEPVCDAKNAFNPSAKRIKTHTPGEAELIGEKWIVHPSKKAIIIYE